jgi:hypothetical protein
MPAEIGTYVFAVSTDGDIYYTIRPPNSALPTWHSLRSQTGNRSAFHSVAAAGDSGTADPAKFNVHVAATTWDGRLLHSRLGPNGTWTPFVDVDRLAGPKFGGGQWWRVDAYGKAGFPEGEGPYDLFEPYATTTIGQAFTTTRTGAGDWSKFSNLAVQQTQGPLNFEIADHSVFADANESTVHRIGVYRGGMQRYEGSLWHLRERRSLLTGQLSRSPYVDVSRRAGQVGGFIDASCSTTSNNSTDLHLCGITLDGRLWHTLRLLDWYFPIFLIQSWTPFREVHDNQGFRAGTCSRVACRTSGETLHVCALGDQNDPIWYITRHPDGVWDEHFDFIINPNSFPLIDVALVPG